MHERWDVQTLSDVRGTDVYSADGEKIGSVEEIYYDDQSGEPEWVGLGTGFLGMKRKVVPVEGLRREGDHLQVPFTKERIQNEPEYDFEEMISNEAESALCSYFGLPGEHQHSTRIYRLGEEYRGPNV
jgi:hypothetical protein